MKKFTFRLDKLKEFRENEMKEAQRELGRCVQFLSEAENNLELLKQERNRNKKNDDTVLTAGQLTLVSDYEEFIEVLIKKQMETIQEAEIAVENAREALISRASSEKALSLLKERKYEEFLTEKKRHDRKEISDIALRQYTMRQKNDGE